MSKAQQLALATEVNDERNEPIRDIPREKLDQQKQELPSNDELGRLESAAAWKGAELGLEALSGASLTGLPALISLFEPPKDPHRSVYSGIYVWAKQPVDYEKSENQIQDALRVALSKQVSDLRRIPSPHYEYKDYLSYIATENGKTVRVVESVANPGEAEGFYNNDRDLTFGEYDPTVSASRVPDWLPENHNALLKRRIWYFYQYTPGPPESMERLTGTDKAIRDDFPGIDNLQFMRDLSAALPTNMVIYYRHFEGVEGSVPLFLHDGTVHPFIEPKQDSKSQS
jgi:hypothetical protein